MKVIRYTDYEGRNVVGTIDEFLDALREEIDWLGNGDSYTVDLEITEMSQAEYDALPSYDDEGE